MKRKFCASFLAAVLAVLPSFAAEVVAKFASISDGAKSGVYIAKAHENGYGYVITGSHKWSNKTGVSVLVRYEGLDSYNQAALVTLAQDNKTEQSLLGVMASTFGRLYGVIEGDQLPVYSNKVRTEVSNYLTDTGSFSYYPPSSGYVVLVYDGDNGTYAYNGSGVNVFKCSALKYNDDVNGANVGFRFDVGDTANEKITTYSGFKITGVEILKGTVSASEIAELVSDFESSGAVVSFEWTPGENPTGWFTSWKGENGGSPQINVIGPDGSIETVCRIYNSSKNGDDNKWHPYTESLGTKTTYTLSAYATVDFVSTPAAGKYAVLWAMGTKAGDKTVLAMNEERHIVLLQATGNTINKAIDAGAIKGYHLITATFDTNDGASLAIDDGIKKTDETFTKSAANLQIGSILQGCPDSFERGEGFVIKKLLGFDKVLDVAAIADLLTAYSPSETINKTILIDRVGETIYLPSITIPDGKQLRVQAGTLAVPASVEATLAAIEFGDKKEDPVYRLELDGSIRIRHDHEFTSNSAQNAYAACNDGHGVIFGEWTGTGTYNIRGTFDAADTIVLLKHDAGAQSVNVVGGVFKVKGVTAKSAGATIELSSGGLIDFGEYASAPSATIAKKYGNGTITGMADWEDKDAIMLTDGEKGTTFKADGITLVYSGGVNADSGKYVIEATNGGFVDLGFGEPTVDPSDSSVTIVPGSYKGNLTVEAGRTLRFTGKDCVMSGVISGAGKVVVDVGETSQFTFAAANTFTGGLYVESGYVKTTSMTGYGPNNYGDLNSIAHIYVAKGATLDLGGTKDTCYIIHSSGTITNTGIALGNNTRQTTELYLTGDTTVSGNTFGIVRANHSAAKLDLGEFDLNVEMNDGSEFVMANTTVSGSGRIRLLNGKLNFRASAAGAIDIDLDALVEKSPVTVTTSYDATTASAVKGVVSTSSRGWKIEESGNNLIATYSDIIAEIDGIEYSTIKSALRHIRSGSIVRLVKDGLLAEDFTAINVALAPNEDGSFTATPVMEDGAALRISEVMPKPSDKPKSITTEAGYDKNGLESGWVELENTSDKWVDLKDYRFIRVNRGKANSKGDYGNFPSVLIPPRTRYAFYTSERYSNSASKKDSAFAEGTFTGAPQYFEKYDMLIWGDKVNPKKCPFVRLSYFPEGGEETILSTVVVPSDIPEGYSIIVEDPVDGVSTKRYMTSAPTFEAENAATELVALGPSVGPLYETKTVSKKGVVTIGAKHESANEFGAVAPAKVGENYLITFALNPVMSPTEAAAFREEDAIKSITLQYRSNFGAIKTQSVDLSSVIWDNTDKGYQYTAEIPAADLPGPGLLVQWKFKIVNAQDEEFISPSFRNKDDGYEWYGTIVEPTEDLLSEKLITWHMFTENANHTAQMDVDVDKQDLSKVPYNARVSIYDSSTSNYYDYVRIDLRGNTSAHFNKKSHGLRFSKANPLTIKNCVTGETHEEIRKSSLIGEPADPSYMRQMMSFWLWSEMGNKVPFDFPVRCNLNGAFYQLAFHSERFTDELIEDVYKFDKYGYSYKNVGTLKSNSGTSAGSIEKKTPDDGNDSDVSILQSEFRAKLTGVDAISGTSQAARSAEETDQSGLNNAAVTKFVVEKFNLPAWLNYLASARITQEMDDVWANICIYYDNAQMLEGVRGTDTWMPLGYDFNLSLGQWYWNDVGGQRVGLVADRDWFKSHPLYGGNRVRCWKGAPGTESKAAYANCNNGNNGYEAVFQSDKFRRLYLRRLRTLMDGYLGEPNEEESFETTTNMLVVKMKEVADLMRDDAAKDRVKWPWDNSISNIDVWGEDNFPKTMDEGIEEIWSGYIVPRRQHLYVTHSTHSSMNVGYGTNLAAGIPDAQSAIGMLKDGFSAEYNAEIGTVVIKNANPEVVDMSGWVLSGPVSMTLPAGTVIDQCDEATPAELYVTADRRATIAKMNELGMITDQVVVGNGEAFDTEAITLKAGEETVIAPPEPSEQEKYLKLYGFCGAPLTDNDGIGEFIIFENIGTEALDVGGAAINICKTADADSASKCVITLAEGVSIAGGDYLRIAMADNGAKFGGTWSKITDGDLRITMTDSTGVQIYYRESLSQSAIGVKAVDKFAKHIYADDIWVAAELSEAPGYVAPEPPPVDPVDPPAEGDITGDFNELQTLAAGTYTINGANFNGGLKIDGDVTLTLKGTNTLSTMTTAGVLTIDGDGTLTINYNDGEKGTAAVTLTKPYIQNGGNVVVNLSSENQVFGFYCDTATKDELGNGIYAVELNGGTFTTTIAGGESSAVFKLGKGSNDAKLGGTDVTVTLGGTAPRFINTDGKIKLTKNCGKVTVATATEGGTKANVFKSKKEIEINGGTVVATASGDGSEIFSSDDTILVKGGVLNLTAADDCFSAANHINVTGGIVYAMSTAGDAIDSNGDMMISGGYVFAFATSTEHEALDVDPSEDPTAIDNGIAHKLYINEGATVVSVGGLSAVHGPDDGSTAKCLVKTGLSSSSKYLVMTGIVDDENVRRTTTATINWNKKHAKTFALIATMPGFTGEITEGGDEVKPSTGKLADEISGMFVNTVESSIVTPSGATTWEEVEVTESTTVEELVGAEQAQTLAKFEEVTPEIIANWAKEYSTHTKPGGAIDLEAFALNCAPNEEAIDAAKKNFKVTITMTEEGPVAKIESGFYNITPVLKGKVELPEENWIEVTDDNKDTFRFFRAFIEIGD